MRLNGNWRIASLLSVALLLSGGDLCMVFTCAPHASQDVAWMGAHHTCSEAGATQDGHHDSGCARPCDVSVTLTAGPQLSSPNVLTPVMPQAVPAASMADGKPVNVPGGPIPRGQSHARPPAPLFAASGIRAPPSA
jgi:hypothetical protein